MRPTRLHRYDRLGEQPVAPVVHNPDGAEALTDLEHNFERLTLDILDVRIDDFHLHYQRHTVGAPEPISHFL